MPVHVTFRALRVAAMITAATTALALAAAAPAMARTAAAPTPGAALDRTAVHDSHDSLLHFPTLPGRYVVTLKTRPAASYTGGVAGIARTKPAHGHKLAATAPNTVALRHYLRTQQSRVAASVGAKPLQQFDVALNGFSATLSATQLTSLRRNSAVAAVVPDQVRRVQNDQVDYDFLGLSGKKGVWNSVGGSATAGRGIVIGVVDTGIWPESASFSAPKLASSFSAKNPYRAYRDGNTVVMHKADGSTFTGTCQTGQDFTAADCNTKIVGAQYFDKGFLSVSDGGKLGSEDYESPRDGEGHGTHTASESAGNRGVDAVVNGHDYGKISGMAPGASISVYKALFSGKLGGQDVAGAGITSDLVAAIDAATLDGVDVINYSVGGGSESGPDDPIQQAFLSAASAGVFIAAAGGNDGPDPSTLDNTMPWETTAAASSLAPYYGSVTLGNGKKYTGASNTVLATVGPKPLVQSGQVALAGAASDQADLCAPDTLDPAKVVGTIVVCDRGVIGRTVKSAEVKRAGGVGMILVNTSDLDLDADIHAVPTVHLNVPDATDVRTYAMSAGATATLVPGNITGIVTPYPQVAPFSSRGPSTSSNGDLLKPDIAAPGVAVLAAIAPPTNSGHQFEFESGTSMAAPHIAGLGALLMATNPTLTPAEVKSAMMTTAGPTYNPDGSVSTDAFAQGAGEVQPRKMLDPGLVYNAGDDDWLNYLEGLGIRTGTGATPVPAWNYNGPSFASGRLIGTRTFTRTVTAVQPGIYHASASVPGMDVSVTPNILSFQNAGETRTFKVTMTQNGAPSGKVTNGSLVWTGNGLTVRSPVAVTPFQADAPTAVTGSGTSGSVSYEVTPGAGNVSVKGYGLTSAEPITADTDADDPQGTAKLIQFEVGADTKAVDILATPADAAANLCALVANGTPDDLRNNTPGTHIVDDLIDCSLGGRVDLTSDTLEPGTYTALIETLSNAPGTDSTPVTIQLNQVSAPGSLSVTPTTGPAFAGSPFTVKAAWTGAPAGQRSVGYVEYGGDVGTVVKVDN